MVLPRLGAREVEGLARRHGDPAPSPRSLAPDWTSIHAESPAAVGKPLTPPLDPLPQRSMLALERAAWGGARSAQKDPAELQRLQDLGLLRADLTPTPQGSLLVGRLTGTTPAPPWSTSSGRAPAPW